MPTKYSKDDVAMARKMLDSRHLKGVPLRRIEEKGKIYVTPKSREQIMSETYIRLQKSTPKGEKFQFSIPIYPTYAKGKDTTA